MLPIGTRITLYQVDGVSVFGNAINLGPVRSALTNDIVIDASGSLSVFDSLGNLVAGASSIPMTYTGNGIYQGVINSLLFIPTPGEAYTCITSLSSPTYGPGVEFIPTTIIPRPN